MKRWVAWVLKIDVAAGKKRDRGMLGLPPTWHAFGLSQSLFLGVVIGVVFHLSFSSLKNWPGEQANHPVAFKRILNLNVYIYYTHTHTHKRNQIKQRALGRLALGAHGKTSNEGVQGGIGWTSFEGREPSSKTEFEERLMGIGQTEMGRKDIEFSVRQRHRRSMEGRTWGLIFKYLPTIEVISKPKWLNKL